MTTLFNRIQNMIQPAIGVLVGTHKVQIKAQDDEVLSNIHRLQWYGLSIKPKKGYQSFTVFPSGDRTEGYDVLQSDTRFTIESLEEGEVCLHDDQGMKIYLRRGQMEVDVAGFPLNIINASEVLADTPLLKCTGDMIDNCDDNPVSMQDMRETFNLHNHQGDSGGSTSETNNRME